MDNIKQSKCRKTNIEKGIHVANRCKSQSFYLSIKVYTTAFFDWLIESTWETDVNALSPPPLKNDPNSPFIRYI